MFTDEDKERFNDIETYKAFRHNLEDALNVGSSLTLHRLLFVELFLVSAFIHAKRQ